MNHAKEAEKYPRTLWVRGKSVILYSIFFILLKRIIILKLYFRMWGTENT